MKAVTRLRRLILPVTAALMVSAATAADEIQLLPLAAFSEPVASSELDQSRGGEAMQVMLTQAELSDATVTGSPTGSNTIDGGAFAETSGLASVIQNTGNNVIIQDSTIINVELHAGPPPIN